jgi:hypothetical protein
MSEVEEIISSIKNPTKERREISKIEILSK